MNQSVNLGETFPEIFRQPINLAQQLDDSGLDHYQQEHVKRHLWRDYVPGEIE